MTRRLWQVLLALLYLVITALALLPDPPTRLGTGWDKSNHALAFAALAFVSVQALWPERRDWLRLALVVLAYGAGIEIAQTLLPPRQGEWLDVLADAAGIGLGLAVAHGLSPRRNDPA